MKALTAIFILAISLSMPALAVKVPKPSAYDCKGDKDCERRGDGAAVAVPAATNANKCELAMALDPDCKGCIQTACETADAMKNPAEQLDAPAEHADKNPKPTAPKENADKQGNG